MSLVDAAWESALPATPAPEERWLPVPLASGAVLVRDMVRGEVHRGFPTRRDADLFIASNVKAARERAARALANAER